MRTHPWLVVALLGATTFTGCECSSNHPPVTQPTIVTSPATSPPRVEKKKKEALRERIPINIRSNAQVIFKGVKIGAGNFTAAERNKSGVITKPATAKLWTAVKGDPSTAQVTQVKVGDTFSVAQLRFKVLALNIPAQAASGQEFVQAGGSKASITVVSLK